MKMYINCLEDLFGSAKERTFTDRTEIMEMLNESLIKLNEDSTSFRVYSIHGMGGIGKTRLVKEFSKLISPEPVIFISFEIEKRSEIINNLYKIRKEINYTCPFFDFALLRYWEQTNPAALNDSFMNLFNKDFFACMLDSLFEIVGGSSVASQGEFSLPSVLSPCTIIDFVNDLHRKIPQLQHSPLFKAISSTSTDQLLSKLPAVLGIEISRLISSGKILTPIFIFDSYQESQPYSESEEWLYHLITAAGKGLYIITSREPLHWRRDSDYLMFYNLQCYPEDEARTLLEETILNRPDLVDQIIESTQCLPIYIDLALNVYEGEKTITKEALIEKTLFCDRHKLVHHFISHMKLSWQSVILDLATIRVFNYPIFQHLIERRMLDCAPYEYQAIIKSNLFNYISESRSSDLIKLHDVFCRDAQNGRPVNECYSIYTAYLDYICFRRDFLIKDHNGSSLAALFQNALHLAIWLEDRLMLEGQQAIEQRVVEQLLDIFFSLVANKVCFIPLQFENIKTSTMKKVCQFVHIKTYEKVNTLKTIEALEQIDDVSCFGKHTLSYEAVLFYSKALSGDYGALESWVNQIDAKLDDQAKCEWFYNRIKIYQADCYMLNGKFKSALASLILLDNGYNSAEDYFSIHRTIGHIQRFNYQFEKAKKTYRSLMKVCHNNSVFREYLATNLAETQCYFPDADFIKHNQKLLDSMNAPYNVKNKGKVLYALAIANTVKKHYRVAQRYIDESIRINLKDGYQSGALFAYMAQAYLDYALTGAVRRETNDRIEHLLVCNKVYSYFRLPLAIMREDSSEIRRIGEEFDWIDFEHTEKECQRFLSQLRNM